MRQLKGMDSSGQASSANRALISLPLAALLLSGCGIGKLDRGSKKDISNASAQSQAVSDAYKKKMGSLTALPKGGPGSGTQPKRTPLPADVDAKPITDSAGPKSFKARVVSLFKGPRRRRAAGEEEQKPSKLRGRYAMSDSGDFFVPCNDTTRYAVQATTEARYLMAERLRFIVRSLKTPVYAVFTAIYVLPKPASDSSTSGRAKSGQGTGAVAQKPATTPAGLTRKAIFVSKVDTLTTTFPPACRPPMTNRSAGG